MTKEEDPPRIEPLNVPELEGGEEAESGIPEDSTGGRESGAEPPIGRQGPPDRPLELDLEAVPGHPQSPRPNLAQRLRRNWIRGVALLFGLTVVSAMVWLLLAHRDRPAADGPGTCLDAVTASLGGEHYLRFILCGPFRDSGARDSLRRVMPKIRHELILSGGRPDVAKSIEEADLEFLKRHILGIVGDATGIPVEKMGLRGLSLIRTSDEAEVAAGGSI
jgi:hypothetical protein